MDFLEHLANVKTARKYCCIW